MLTMLTKPDRCAWLAGWMKDIDKTIRRSSNSRTHLFYSYTVIFLAGPLAPAFTLLHCGCAGCTVAVPDDGHGCTRTVYCAPFDVRTVHSLLYVLGPYRLKSILFGCLSQSQLIVRLFEWRNFSMIDRGGFSYLSIHCPHPLSRHFGQLGIIADSYSTLSKTSRKVISDDKNVSSFKVM